MGVSWRYGIDSVIGFASVVCAVARAAATTACRPVKPKTQKKEGKKGSILSTDVHGLHACLPLLCLLPSSTTVRLHKPCGVS